MLWLVAFLLTLAEDVFSQGKKETPAELLHIYRRLRWSAANDAMAEELTGDMNHGHAPWPSLGKNCSNSISIQFHFKSKCHSPHFHFPSQDYSAWRYVRQHTTIHEYMTANMCILKAV